MQVGNLLEKKRTRDFKRPFYFRVSSGNRILWGKQTTFALLLVVKISVGKRSFVFGKVVPLDTRSPAHPQPLPRTSVKTALFPLASVLAAQKRAGTGGTACFCNFPLDHRAVNKVAKPLMEQTLAIREEMSHAAWYKFTVVPVDDLLVMSLKPKALQLLKSKFPCPSGDRPLLA